MALELCRLGVRKGKAGSGLETARSGAPDNQANLEKRPVSLIVNNLGDSCSSLLIAIMGLFLFVRAGFDYLARLSTVTFCFCF